MSSDTRDTIGRHNARHQALSVIADRAKEEAIAQLEMATSQSGMDPYSSPASQSCFNELYLKSNLMLFKQVYYLQTYLVEHLKLNAIQSETIEMLHHRLQRLEAKVDI